MKQRRRVFISYSKEHFIQKPIRFSIFVVWIIFSLQTVSNSIDKTIYLPEDVPDYFTWIDVTTLEPIDVTETSATLRGRINDDGGGPCEYFFAFYDCDSYHDMNEVEYDWVTITDSSCCVSNGQIFEEQVTCLKPATMYYCNAYASFIEGDPADLISGSGEFSYRHGFGEPIIFTTKGYPPTLIYPLENADVDTLTPTFIWSSVPNAIGYVLYISEPPYGEEHLVFESDINYDGLICGTSLNLPSDILSYGVTYKWNMNSYNNAGWSTISNSRYFTTIQQLACSLKAFPKSSGKIPLIVTFLINAESAQSNSISRWELDLDGNEVADLSGTGNPPLGLPHTYTTYGHYKVKLTVWDDHNNSVSDVKTINVGSICVPDDYATIQDALVAAEPNDFIVVRESSYIIDSTITVPEHVILLIDPSVSLNYEQSAILLVEGELKGEDATISIDVTEFSQRDGDWGSEPYDHMNPDLIYSSGNYEAKGTIGNWGCALTCCAMVLNYFSIDTNPLKLNTWLIENDGYSKEEEYIGNLDWEKVKIAHGANLKLEGPLGKDDSKLNELLSKGQPVILHVTGVTDHYVVATGKTKVDGVDIWYINDPWFPDRTDLLNGWDNKYSRMRVFKRID